MPGCAQPKTRTENCGSNHTILGFCLYCLREYARAFNNLRTFVTHFAHRYSMYNSMSTGGEYLSEDYYCISHTGCRMWSKNREVGQVHRIKLKIERGGAVTAVQHGSHVGEYIDSDKGKDKHVRKRATHTTHTLHTRHTRHDCLPLVYFLTAGHRPTRRERKR